MFSEAFSVATFQGLGSCNKSPDSYLENRWSGGHFPELLHEQHGLQVRGGNARPDEYILDVVLLVDLGDLGIRASPTCSTAYSHQGLQSASQRCSQVQAVNQTSKIEARTQMGARE